ncbi:MAG: hypothetical protein KDA84_15160, partial [Planctomycetaceae bacterium]|nr:hypothetical protein [Planctomycetaceae bacterium]
MKKDLPMLWRSAILAIVFVIAFLLVNACQVEEPKGREVAQEDEPQSQSQNKIETPTGFGKVMGTIVLDKTEESEFPNPKVIFPVG